MDTSEPSTNGTSASNLFRLSSLLGDDVLEDQQGQCEGGYSERAKETIAAFEAEILQYPWGFGSFMPGVVAGRLGVKGVMVIEGPPHDSLPSMSEAADKIATSFATAPRGGLSTILKVSPSTGAWLKQRNPLLRDVTFPPAGKVKVLVCEHGVCREEGLEEEMEGLGLGEASLPTTSGPEEGERMPDDKAGQAKDGAESAA
jgi:uncharacterized protein YyaL (SSP411 family)